MKQQFILQPILKNNEVILIPLKEIDFEDLFLVASDPLIWEQHPNKDRYKREVFQTFFDGAMQSGGAFLISDSQTKKIIGSSRFYDLATDHIKIGYTFFSRDCWGKSFNKSTKALMLHHAFQFFDFAIFHVGATNFRSQKAMEKLGAIKIGEEEVAYHGEAVKLNFVYRIDKQVWIK